MRAVRFILALVIFGGLIAAMWLAPKAEEIYARKPLPNIFLTGLGGKEMQTRWWGGPSVINIFASWCSPCKQELPLLKKLSSQTHLYGIAWQDKPEDLQKWLAANGNPFRDIGLDNGATLMLALRLDGVPTTLLVDRFQRIVYVHKGLLTEEVVQKEFVPRLKKLL